MPPYCVHSTDCLVCIYLLRGVGSTSKDFGLFFCFGRAITRVVPMRSRQSVGDQVRSGPRKHTHTGHFQSEMTHMQAPLLSAIVDISGKEAVCWPRRRRVALVITAGCSIASICGMEAEGGPSISPIFGMEAECGPRRRRVVLVITAGCSWDSGI